jgi:VWFA-related protein
MVCRVSACVALLVSACVTGGFAQEPQGIDERVDVTRVLLDVRVVDPSGRPVGGLGPSDFVVRIAGAPARVESVEWVGHPVDGDEEPDVAAVGGHATTASRGVTAGPVPDSGRLVVFLFQKSLERGRITGLMRMLLDARDFLDTFTEADRIAVLSFDHRLTVWLDFTSDLHRVREVFEHAVLFGRAAPVQGADGPSLLDRLTSRQARQTYTIEDALHRLGEALEPLPGAKSVVLVGHGFGELGLSGVTLPRSYNRAREALQAARASVFSLDVTEADYHSLEKGLQTVAEQTGGFFARTHIFPAQAFNRLAGALAGHYVLLVEPPRLDPGNHRVDVRVNGGVSVLTARESLILQEGRTAGR